MKLGVLTSSRADFGIYLPLLKLLDNSENIELTIIAFGTHVSPGYGKTISEIKKQNFKLIDTINSSFKNDSPKGISSSYGQTVSMFSNYWSENTFDLVFCLGDRFEMSAAVQSSIPFGVELAHIHGGETTLGAIDNVYRHQITLASKYHFCSTEEYKTKISQIVGSSEKIFNVGSLSLDGIEDFKFIDELEFRNQFEIPNKPYILVTFHPETLNPEKNYLYVSEMKNALKDLSKNYFLVITMPNADTIGTIYRDAIQELNKEIPETMLCIESFGKTNYFNAMKYAEFLLGNTSSGILEAASFGKYVVNVGKRQKGRARSKNILDCSFTSDEIIKTSKKVKNFGLFEGVNIYRKEHTSKNIVDIIKSNYASL